ncbi:MAG: carotenoid 1,2-hydratase [Chloroflexi bacterium]|nr:MAG: carotenoid 1,2-hydratase [Chloroflexota bacterium]MBL1196418.1 carotenoid 1,2-hydratase [Chloroflexota bacterium]NOH13713.1 carotenoid 1,2-hydratase [Chloroflexota bacterium]
MIRNKLFITTFTAIFFLVSCNAQPEQVTARVFGGAAQSIEGFQRADGPQTLIFPDDFGPHPEYLTEWWYYTGNLQTDSGRPFGYQLTFFRRALAPPDETTERVSDWASDQIYFAHFAISDIDADQHYSFERFTRGAAGLAGAQAEPYEVWLDEWRVEQIGEDHYSLFATQDGISIDLTFTDEKGPVLQGIEGYSQKGPEAGNASYYYSQTRLVSSGTIEIDGEVHEVAGLSWKDHEYSTSVLSDGLVGWDWFSIQLSDGSDLMVYQLRYADGRIGEFSSGTLIAPDGSTTPLSIDDFELEVNDTWLSPHSEAEYPSAWTLSIPSVNLTLNVTPRMADQEMLVSFIYWEGAISVNGNYNGLEVTGNGYVELTGYAGSLEGEF